VRSTRRPLGIQEDRHTTAASARRLEDVRRARRKEYLSAVLTVVRDTLNNSANSVCVFAPVIDLEQQSPDRIRGVVPAPSEAERHTLRGEFVCDVARISERSSQPVELCDDEGASGAHCGESVSKPGSGAIGAGHSALAVDVRVLNAQAKQGVSLGGEVLICSRDPGSQSAIHPSAQRPAHGALPIWIHRSAGRRVRRDYDALNSGLVRILPVLGV
jgi:hypothetical protein